MKVVSATDSLFALASPTRIPRPEFFSTDPEWYFHFWHGPQAPHLQPIEDLHTTLEDHPELDLARDHGWEPHPTSSMFFQRGSGPTYQLLQSRSPDTRSGYQRGKFPERDRWKWYSKGEGAHYEKTFHSLQDALEGADQPPGSKFRASTDLYDSQYPDSRDSRDSEIGEFLDEAENGFPYHEEDHGEDSWDAE